MPDNDAMIPEVAALVQLFSAQPRLVFPDLDAATLHEAVAKVKDRTLDVAKAEAQLAAVRAACDEELEQLLKLAHRAQAYLRIYAETDATLAERVEAIALPRLKRPSPKLEVAAGEEPPSMLPRKRGRPRKVTTEAPLFAVEAAAS